MTVTVRMVLPLLAAAVLCILGVFSQTLFHAGLLVAVLTVLLAMADRWLLPEAAALEVVRCVPAMLPVEADTLVELFVEHSGSSTLDLIIHDEPPDEFELREVNFAVRLGRRERRRLTYRVRPQRRGDYRFHRVVVVCRGPLVGMIRRHYAYDRSTAVKVYPNYRELAKFDLLTLRGRLQAVGVRAARRHGMSTEFESLREYTVDDEYRRINWHASARAGKLIATQYQEDKSQNVMLLIDTGRMMGTQSFGRSRLDHAIQAAMMLAHASVRNGDKVGLLVFSNRIHRFLPPGRRHSQVARLAEQVYNIESTLVESNYSDAVEYLRQHHKRRSLVVLFTDVIDRYASQMLIRSVSALYPKHLPLCVVMKDPLLERLVETKDGNKENAYQKAVSAELLGERQEAIGYLRNHGVDILDVFAADMTAELINRYIEIKSRALL